MWKCEAFNLCFLDVFFVELQLKGQFSQIKLLFSFSNIFFQFTQKKFHSPPLICGGRNFKIWENEARVDDM